jgi:putative flippase GtrA
MSSSKVSTAGLLLAILGLLMAFTVGVYLNMYTLNSFMFPFFGVETEVSYWGCILFTATANYLLNTRFTASESKYKGDEQIISFFVGRIISYAIQYLATWLSIKYLLGV